MEAFLARAAEWAAGRPEIRALALVGSRARGTARPDSDIDLVLLADEQDELVEGDEWLGSLGGARMLRTVPRGVLTERRFLLPGGLEVDLGVAPRSWAATQPVDPGTRRATADGMRILYDPDGLLARLTAVVG